MGCPSIVGTYIHYYKYLVAFNLICDTCMQTGIMYTRVDILSLSLSLSFSFSLSHSLTLLSPSPHSPSPSLSLKFLFTVVFDSVKLNKWKTLDKRHHHHHYYYYYYQVRVCVSVCSMRSCILWYITRVIIKCICLVLSLSINYMYIVLVFSFS